MKTITSKISLFVLAMLASIFSFAQDKTVDVNIGVDKGGSDWYSQPWVWVVGGAVFLLLLVALIRGNNNKS